MERADVVAASLPDPFFPDVYRVRRVQRELADTVTLELIPRSGARPSFQPGQFNMLYMFGVGEVAISMSGSTTLGNAYVHTVRDVGAVSGAIAGLKPGDEIGVRGPFGAGWPVREAGGADVVIVAGGLGLAPLRPAILHLLANRGRYGRVVILFGSRNPAEILFRHEIEQWRQRLDVDIHVTVDHADADWRGNVGVVPELVARATFDAGDAVALVCGPEVMMRFSVFALQDAGVPAESIYVSMERNMKCAIGLCGHCQFGPTFVCKDGPVMRYDRIADIFRVREI
jgi:NAD(P)H-flavin reductase